MRDLSKYLRDIASTRNYSREIFNVAEKDATVSQAIRDFAQGQGFYEDSNSGVQFHVCERQEDQDELFKAISEAFCEGEPMSKKLGCKADEMCEGEFYGFVALTDFKKFSVVMKKEGKVIGGIIAFSEKTAPKEPRITNKLAEDHWKKQKRMLALLRACHPADVTQIDQAVHGYCTGILKDFRGLKLWYPLKILHFLLSHYHGYEFEFVECTHYKSASMNEHFGKLFEPVLYMDFEVEGERPFAGWDEGVTFCLIKV